MLSLKQVENICLVGDETGKKCRYISKKDGDVYVCLKLATESRKTIDEQVQSYVDATYNSKSQIHPPLGDNCVGYKVSLYVEQGYDIKRKQS